MPLILQRIIWDDNRPSMDPEDYSVIADGKDVGRIYRTRVAGAATKWPLGDLRPRQRACRQPRRCQGGVQSGLGRRASGPLYIPHAHLLTLLAGSFAMLRSNWRLILAIIVALAVIGTGVAYKYTGDFTGLLTFGTSGRHQ